MGEFKPQLAEKLGEERLKEIANLSSFIDFKENLVDMMDANNCSDVVRESVLMKMERLTEVLAKIYQINAMHIKNDEKKARIEKELDGLDLKNFRAELFAEISATNKTLFGKMKEIAKNIKDATSQKLAAVNKKFKDDMDFVEESMKEAKKKEAKLKRGDKEDAKDEEVEPLPEEKPQEEIEQLPEEELNKEYSLEELEDIKAHVMADREEVKAKKQELQNQYEKVVDERQLTVANDKALKFWPTFKRLWDHRKDDPNKKQGLFAVLKNAYKEFSFTKAELSKSGAQEKVDEKIDDLYNKQLELAMQIKKYEKDYKELSRQLKDLNKDIAMAGQACLEEAKETLDQVTAPIEKKDITPEKINKVADKVEKFGSKLGKAIVGELKDWRNGIAVAVGTVLAYTVDPIVDVILGDTNIDKTEELEKQVKDAQEKADLAKRELEAAGRVKDSREATYAESKEKLANLTKEDYIEEKLGRRAIKGIHGAQRTVANVRYRKKNRAFERADAKVEKAQEELRKYRSARNSSGPER